MKLQPLQLTPDDASLLVIGGQVARNNLLSTEQVDVILSRSNGVVHEAGLVLFGRKPLHDASEMAQLLATKARELAASHGSTRNHIAPKEPP